MCGVQAIGGSNVQEISVQASEIGKVGVLAIDDGVAGDEVPGDLCQHAGGGCVISLFFRLVA